MPEQLQIFNPEELGRRKILVYQGSPMSGTRAAAEVSVVETVPEEIIYVGVGHATLAADAGCVPGEYTEWDGRLW